MFCHVQCTHRLLLLLLPLDIGVDTLSDGELQLQQLQQLQLQQLQLPDGELAGPLADLGQVGAGESLGHLGEVGDVDAVRHGRLAEVGLEDGQPAAVVREGDVDQLVKTSRPAQMW